MSEADSLDDEQGYYEAPRDHTSFRVSGELKACSCVEVKSMVLPDLRQALRARGVSPAGSRNVLVERLIQTLIERGESMPPDPETAGPADPQPRSSGAGSHVGYLFGQPERDAPDNLGGLASPGAPRGRKSFAVAASVPFGTTADLQATTEKLSEAQLSGSLPCASPAPFKTDEQARFPARSSLPSAPPPPQSDAAVERALSSISKMTLPELREALRARGLSPAGGLEVLANRLGDCVRGLPSDAPPFVAVNDSGMDWPKADEPPISARISAPGSKGRANVIGGAAAGGGTDSMRSLLAGGPI